MLYILNYFFTLSVNKWWHLHEFLFSYFRKDDSRIRNIDSSSSCESGQSEYEPTPGPSSETVPLTLTTRCSNTGRRSFHITSRTAWARRRHKLQNSI